MLSFVSRVLGFVVFAVGVVALIGDGIRSIAADRVVLTSLGGEWATISAPSYAAFRAFVASHLSAEAASLVTAAFETLPTLAVAIGVGALLLVAGRKSRRKPRHLLY